jgi:hypothetical protein
LGFFEDTLITDLFAFGIALLAIFIFEFVKRPHIDIGRIWYADISEIPNMRKRARIAHLSAFNRPIYRNWVQRSTATNCRSKITVKDAAGNVLHREVETKWAAREEPFRTVSLMPVGLTEIKQFTEIKSYLVGQCDRLDIYANNDGEPFAVALKVVDDADCYLFKGESYRSNNQWRLPEYRIPPGNFTIDVYVKGDNAKSSTERYRLLNSGTTPEGLTLESV